jgi:CDP-diacylglycerol--glycerol-3-phosphate 3-phosphatidyltransferase
MLNNASARTAVAGLINPVAQFLLKAGLTPDHVTWIGAIATATSTVVLVPAGHLVAGGLLFIVLSASDLLDGTMARLRGTSSQWGAFLDSTLDRVVDAAVFGSLAWYFSSRNQGLFFAALSATLGALLTSYVRARAEAVGATCHVGFAERPERNVVVTVGLVLHTLASWILPLCTVVLAFITWLTVAQRMIHVRKQLH